MSRKSPDKHHHPTRLIAFFAWAFPLRRDPTSAPAALPQAFTAGAFSFRFGAAAYFQHERTRLVVSNCVVAPEPKDKIMSKPDRMSPASHKDIVRQILAKTGRIVIKGGKLFFVSDL